MVYVYWYESMVHVLVYTLYCKSVMYYCVVGSSRDCPLVGTQKVWSCTNYYIVLLPTNHVALHYVKIE